jgi:hypothetical protein
MDDRGQVTSWSQLEVLAGAVLNNVSVVTVAPWGENPPAPQPDSWADLKPRIVWAASVFDEKGELRACILLEPAELADRPA